MQAAANPGWGRRQLEQRARRQLLKKDDEHDDKKDKHDKDNKGKNRVPNKTIPLTYTILTRSGSAANQGVRTALESRVACVLPLVACIDVCC